MYWAVYPGTPSFSLALLHRLGYEAAHPLCGLPLHLPGDVGVGVQCEASAVVAQDAGYRFGVHSLLDRQRGERVPIEYNRDNTDKSSYINELRIFKCSFSMIFGARKPSKRGCRI